MSEWVVFDAETDYLSLVRASSWRDAVLKAFERDDVLPRNHLHVRDRTGPGPNVQDESEFEEFMATHF